MRARTSIRVAATAFLLLGCDPFAFDDLSDEAPTRVFEAPDSYPRRGYGTVVAGFEGELDGQRVSRFVATGGTDSPVILYRGWEGNDFVGGSSLFELCDDDGDCDEGAGAAIAGVPVWRAGSPDEGRLCMLITAPTSGNFIIRCEQGAGTSGGERFTGPAAQRFGASAASLGPGNPVGVAVVGAPDAPSGAGTGTLYRIPDGSGAVEIEPTDFDPAIVSTLFLAGGRLGEAVAATRLSDGSTLVAAGAPGVGRVVLIQLVSDGAGGIERPEVRACLDDGAGGYGEVLAFGDPNDDGNPDLFVGSGPETEGRLTVVHMYDGAGLPDPGGVCTGDDWGSAPVEIGCPEGLRDGTVGCGFNGFGAAIATGDVNGDGVDDLIVGAPFAEVDGTDAGAVFVIPGSSSGLDAGRADALTHSSPESGDELGFAVTVVPTHLDGSPRVEPVAGSPGRDAVLVFLCSGLDGDTQAIGEQCIAN